MNTSQLADRPIKKRDDKVSRYLMTFWLSLYIVAGVMNVAGGNLPQRNVIDNTSAVYGWLHGFYAIPNFLATLASDEYSIFQHGGGVGYDVAYFLGTILSAYTLKSCLSARKDRRNDCL